MRQIVYECLFDVKFDFQNSEMHIFPAVNRCADPTDRPFDPSSSPDHGGSVEDRHDAAPFGNKGAEKSIA